MNSGLVRVAGAVPKVAVGNLKSNKENIVLMILEAESKGRQAHNNPEES